MVWHTHLPCHSKVLNLRRTRIVPKRVLTSAGAALRARRSSDDRGASMPSERGGAGGVAVVGLGARTAVGLTAPASAAAVARASRVWRAPLHDRHGRQEDDRRPAPLTWASAPTGCLPWPNQPPASVVRGLGSRVELISVRFGLPPPRPGQPGQAKAVAERLSEVLRDTGRVGRVEVIDTGHAAGLAALQGAWATLRWRRRSSA